MSNMADFWISFVVLVGGVTLITVTAQLILRGVTALIVRASTVRQRRDPHALTVTEPSTPAPTLS